MHRIWLCCRGDCRRGRADGGGDAGELALGLQACCVGELSVIEKAAGEKLGIGFLHEVVKHDFY